jgi:hypothetical protein
MNGMNIDLDTLERELQEAEDTRRREAQAIRQRIGTTRQPVTDIVRNGQQPRVTAGTPSTRKALTVARNANHAVASPMGVTLSVRTGAPVNALPSAADALERHTLAYITTDPDRYARPMPRLIGPTSDADRQYQRVDDVAPIARMTRRDRRNVRAAAQGGNMA